MSRILPLVAVLLASLGLARGSAAAGEQCYSDWSAAAPIVKKEGLLSVEELTPVARQKLNGEIVKVTLCEAKGGFVFRLVVRGLKGDLKTVTVDAKNPF